jgi:hypothetical protein
MCRERLAEHFHAAFKLILKFLKQDFEVGG